jgi:hypothetical protein
MMYPGLWRVTLEPPKIQSDGLACAFVYPEGLFPKTTPVAFIRLYKSLEYIQPFYTPPIMGQCYSCTKSFHYHDLTLIRLLDTEHDVVYCDHCRQCSCNHHNVKCPLIHNSSENSVRPIGLSFASRILSRTE